MLAHRRHLVHAARSAVVIAVLIVGGAGLARHATSGRDPAGLVLYGTGSQNGELAPCG
jgi:hypothetical protein